MSVPQQSKPSQQPKGRLTLRISLIAFVLFMINLLIGKANIVFGWHLLHMDNVGEFLLLFIASTFLIVSAMLREKKGQDAKDTKP